jgi:hypothetical protein
MSNSRIAAQRRYFIMLENPDITAVTLLNNCYTPKKTARRAAEEQRGTTET